MKNPIIFLAVLFGLGAQGCKKSNTQPADTIYRGVVIVSICGSVAVQTIGPDYIGQENWTNANYTTRPVLHHVFKVQNACQITGVRDTFNFKIIPNQLPQECVLCNMVADVPDTTYAIEVVN